MSLPITTLEPHETGALNVNGIINGNWEIIEGMMDPGTADSDPVFGVVADAVQAQAPAVNAVTYADPLAFSLLNRLSKVTLTGSPTVTIGDKTNGRMAFLILTASGADRTVTWPVGATWAGPALTVIPSGTTAVVLVISTGTTDGALILAGVLPADLVTLAGSQTLTNKVLTSARFNEILDTGGNEALKFTATASAVNELTVANAATGSGPTVTASGGDTNIDVTFGGKGTGAVILPKVQATLATAKPHADLYVEVTSSRAATDADNGKVLWSSAAYTVTFPDSLTKPFSCSLKQEGAGAITVAVSGTAVLRNIDTHTKTGGQWSVAGIDYRTGNDVVLTGRTAA